MITITLPDEVALQLMTQISGQVGKVLSKQNEQEREPKVKKNMHLRPEIEEYLSKLDKGAKVFSKAIAKHTGEDVGKIAAHLYRMTERGLLEYIDTGTWRKV